MGHPRGTTYTPRVAPWGIHGAPTTPHGMGCLYGAPPTPHGSFMGHHRHPMGHHGASMGHPWSTTDTRWGTTENPWGTTDNRKREKRPAAGGEEHANVRNKDRFVRTRSIGLRYRRVQGTKPLFIVPTENLACQHRGLGVTG
ncbi:unnamed protein product [Laminaria digitata]